jgi:hypothetical protein
MARFTIDLDTDTAEAVMFCLKMGVCRKQGRPETKAALEKVRQQINTQAEALLGWDHFPDRWSGKDDDIRVTIQTRNRW